MTDMQLGRVLFEQERFRSKLINSLAIVSKALSDAKRPYVAFSGGVDSVATLALVHSIDADVPLYWSDDELELPETVDFMRALKQEAGDQMIVGLGWERHAGWFDPWTDKPFWREPFAGAVHPRMDADDYMGDKYYDLTFTGVRMEESRKRRDWLIYAGPIYHVREGTGRRCCPLWDWTKDDVWALIAGWNLPYNPAYNTMEAIGMPRHKQRVGPLPLAPRSQLLAGWPELLKKLEVRYGKRWQ